MDVCHVAASFVGDEMFGNVECKETSKKKMKLKVEIIYEILIRIAMKGGDSIESVQRSPSFMPREASKL